MSDVGKKAVATLRLPLDSYMFTRIVEALPDQYGPGLTVHGNALDDGTRTVTVVLPGVKDAEQ